MNPVAADIIVSGIVQGVGFRPFVFTLAQAHAITGWVLNASDGVHIHAEAATPASLELFVQAITSQAPPMARIDKLASKPASFEDFATFEIRLSDANAPATTLISPDIATCPACTAELFSPADRRYHYPFINCTQCGPRFTIIDSLPYDRPGTSMEPFTMCQTCDTEYHDPANRRFHAQPNACFDCGPSLSYWETISPTQVIYASDLASSDRLIMNAVTIIKAGGIVAVKGLGGFHLVCDACNEAAVSLLRKRKHRPSKPFALMFQNIESVRKYCSACEAEEALLCGSVRPIVLLKRRSNLATPLAPNVAGSLDELGVMLPYTPLQHLLLAQLARPLVMTSGNISEEPILANDDEVRTLLASTADAFLSNNRPILSRYDDSVVRIMGEEVLFLRRARGYAPTPLSLPAQLADKPPLLACGAEQKNTFTLTRGNQAFVSQHLGDLENKLAYDAWEETISLYERLFSIKPSGLVCDLHPEYLSTKWAKEHYANTPTARLEEVQHHHAHIVAVTAEHGVDTPVLGIALDGTGYGPDGCIWGGELLIADWCNYRRVAHLDYLPMPSGSGAIKHPCRMALGLLAHYGLEEYRGAQNLRAYMGEEEWHITKTMIKRKINCPQTSSAGRLLDAIAAITGICTQASYDGEPAISLEAAMYAKPQNTQALSCSAPYTFSLDSGCICARDAVISLLDDLDDGCSAAVISRRFHEGLAQALITAGLEAAAQNNCTVAALGGGVFMNRYLLSSICAGLEKGGLRVLTGIQLPGNDGCISYGQAVVALARQGR